MSLAYPLASTFCFCWLQFLPSTSGAPILVLNNSLLHQFPTQTLPFLFSSFCTLLSYFFLSILHFLSLSFQFYPSSLNPIESHPSLTSIMICRAIWSLVSTIEIYSIFFMNLNFPLPVLSEGTPSHTYPILILDCPSTPFINYYTHYKPWLPFVTILTTHRCEVPALTSRPL